MPGVSIKSPSHHVEQRRERYRHAHVQINAYINRLKHTDLICREELESNQARLLQYTGKYRLVVQVVQEGEDAGINIE